MDELEKLNATITSEADKILHDHGLLQIMSRHGTPVLTGSYVLGLMTWRDLDIYLETNEMTEGKFFQLGNELASSLKPHRMHYRNEFIGRTSTLPAGLYWGIYTSSLGFPDEWKTDIWAIDSNQVNTLQRQLDELKSRIDQDKRPPILAIKNHFCKHPEYRRKFTSSDIYHAVIEEGIRSVGEFSQWLKVNRGILSD
jgi:hypothetical protein